MRKEKIISFVLIGTSLLFVGCANKEAEQDIKYIDKVESSQSIQSVEEESYSLLDVFTAHKKLDKNEINFINDNKSKGYYYFDKQKLLYITSGVSEQSNKPLEIVNLVIKEEELIVTVKEQESEKTYSSDKNSVIKPELYVLLKEKTIPNKITIIEEDNHHLNFSKINKKEEPIETKVEYLTMDWNEAVNHLGKKELLKIESEKKRGFYQLGSKGEFIYITSGSKNTGGYKIEVENVSFENGTYIINIHESSPKPGQITTQVLTNPSIFLKLQTEKYIENIKIVNQHKEVLGELTTSQN